jgi:hypothetical protein
MRAARGTSVIRRPRLAPLLLGLLLAGMAAGQAASFPAFREALRSYDVLVDARAAAVAVLVVEALTAAGLLLSASLPRRAAQAAGIAGLAVAVFWSVLAAQAFARGLKVENCGCFGSYLAQPLRWWVLLEDAYMLLLALLAARALGVPLLLLSLRLRRSQAAAHRMGEAR